MPVRIGIDGGGTSTRSLIYDDEEGILAEAGGPACALSGGLERALQSIGQTLEQALTKAAEHGRPVPARPGAIDAVCLGISGAASLPAGQPLSEGVSRFLGERGYPVSPERILVVSDIEIALAGALGGAPGVVLIVGTGAVAYGRSPGNRTFRADGWGWLLGDAGSGYDIGRAALRAAFAIQDGRREDKTSSGLVAAVTAHFQVSALSQLVPMVYEGRIKVSDIAALSPVVAELAAAGDPVCLAILDEAAEALAQSVLAVVSRLYSGEGEGERPTGPIPVSYQGGVIRHSPVLRELVVRKIEAKGERLGVRCRVKPPAYEPVVGALLLAGASPEKL
ncbi:MAG TPA: hypothetical protein GXX29_01430 [Firmicutes bacterium]|nr:hypothetical protein [Bacillota bacterium]